MNVKFYYNNKHKSVNFVSHYLSHCFKYTYITGWHHYSSRGGQSARKYVAVSTDVRFS